MVTDLLYLTLANQFHSITVTLGALLPGRFLLGQLPPGALTLSVPPVPQQRHHDLCPFGSPLPVSHRLVDLVTTSFWKIYLGYKLSKSFSFLLFFFSFENEDFLVKRKLVRQPMIFIFRRVEDCGMNSCLHSLEREEGEGAEPHFCNNSTKMTAPEFSPRG